MCFKYFIRQHGIYYIILIFINIVAFSVTLHAGNIIGTLDLEYPEETIWKENVAIEMERLNQEC